MIEIDGTKLYFIEDVAELTEASTRTIRRDINAELINGIKINGGYVFTEDDIKSYKDKKEAAKMKDCFIVECIDGHSENDPFIKVNDDFICSEHFNGYEKMAFLALKGYATLEEDEQGETGEVTMTIDNLSRAAGIPRSTAYRAIKGLQKKGAIDVKNNGYKKANTYIIYDYADVWDGSRRR